VHLPVLQEVVQHRQHVALGLPVISQYT
jgi:hypothetical protein